MNSAQQLITALTIAISNCSLYSGEHELIEEAARKTFSILSDLLKDRLEMMILDDDLIVDRVPLKGSGLHAGNLLKCCRRKGVSRIDFLPGITVSEFKQFIVDIATPDRGIRPCPHIRTGSVDLKGGTAKTGAQGGIDLSLDSLSRLREEQVEKLRETFHSISPFKQLTITDLEEIVARFVATISKEISVLKLLCPVKTYSNYTYVHSINVAVLSIFQAESLGVRGKLLHDIGMAALLHDVGKLFIAKEVLEKNGPLDESEFAEMTNHPSYGAAYLANVNGIIRLAPVVAFEHHRKFDGTGYPQARISDKHQHICSQIVAISDFFDALRSWRPYRKSLDTREVIVLMKKNAGTHFNPFLVDTFASSFLKATSQAYH